MFDRYEAGEQAILVHIDFLAESDREDLNELEMLVDSAGVRCIATVQGSRQAPHAKLFVGTGKQKRSQRPFKSIRPTLLFLITSLAPLKREILSVFVVAGC